MTSNFSRALLTVIVVFLLGVPSSMSATAAAEQAGTADEAAIAAWLQRYDEAFNAKDLDRLATFYHPDVTIYEGGGINTGWVDYRDHHLGRN